jgi:hypothetical protein
MRRPEQVFQASLVRHLHMLLTPATYFFAVPNGGYRRRMEAGILIGQGVKPGVPDLIFIHDGRALGLELKSDKGRISDKQEFAHAAMRAAGAVIGLARNLDEALDFLKANGVPLRIKEVRQ